MLRTLIITGVLMAVIGASGLYWCKMEARQAEADSIRFQAKHAGQTQEFVKKVNEQVAKGDKVKLDLSWLRDGKSDEERAQEQHERLLADIDRLAAGAEPIYPEILYGANWRDEVEKYKTDLYQRDMIQIGAIALLIAGGLLMGLGLLLAVVAAIRNIWTHGSTTGSEKDETANKIKAEMKTAIQNLAGTIEAKQKQFLADLTETKPSLQTGENVTARFDESLNKYGKGLQNRLEGLISRIESAYNAGSKRNDEMLTHMHALLKEQGGSLEKMTAEIETLAGSFMHELAKQGNSIGERVGKSFKEHGENLARESATLKKLVKEIETVVAREPADIRGEVEKSLGAIKDSIAASVASANSSQREEFKKLIENMEGIAAVGPSTSIQGEIEEALGELREGIASDMAHLTTSQSEELKQLIEKIEKSAATGIASNIWDHLEELAGTLRAGIASDVASLTSSQSEEMRKLIENIESIVSVGPSTNIRGELEEALGELREGIASDVAGVVATGQSQELGKLMEKIDTVISSMPVDIRSRLEEAISTLREGIAADIAVVKTQISAPQTAAEPIAGRFDELLAAMRQSDAAAAEAVDKIVRKVEELAALQADYVSRQLVGMTPGDSSVTDENIIAKLMGETSAAKEIATTTLDKTETIEKGVAEACRQIWAIREYAARQQDRMEKLQDGYDWNIIGNFCLRIIRCVDNLDDRISELTAAGRDAHHLQTLREELLFAMESSGVERFEVEVGSDFHGQEHRLKALGHRQVTENPELIGKVAAVVRPGYQCYISEESTKTVRAAEVRIYGETSVEEPAIGGSRK
jgi:hypothetical protein